MAIDWFSIGFILVVSWHQIGCRLAFDFEALASDWKSIVIRLDVDLQQIGSQLVSDWLLIGIQLEVNWIKACKRQQFRS